MWEKLATLLRAEPDLLGERITVEHLRTLYDTGYAVIHVEDGEIVGFAALWETSHSEWRELGSVWVHPDYRDKKIASEVFCTCVTQCKKNQIKVLIVSHNTKVIHLAQKASFAEATCTTWKELPWEITCGPCDRFSENEKHSCPFRAKREKCALFFA